MSSIKKTYLHNIDLDHNELISATFEKLASPPSSPVNGQIYYNINSNKLYYYNESISAWSEFSGSVIISETPPPGTAGLMWYNSATGELFIFYDNFWVEHGNSNVIQGPQGTQGIDGVAATITVGTVSTGVEGSNASITNSGTAQDAVFNFTIPRGDKGIPVQLQKSATHIQWKYQNEVTWTNLVPLTDIDTTIAVGTVTTGAGGSAASVTNVGTASDAVFNFVIPAGLNALNYERRHDYNGVYSYCGLAVFGSSESAAVWTISRIEITSGGSTITTSATNVTWTGRYTHTYT
jgi:hypothetical protein